MNIEARPDRCLVVEDAAAGIEAAFRGGMWIAAIGEADLYEMADYRIGHIEQLLPILQTEGGKVADKDASGNAYVRFVE